VEAADLLDLAYTHEGDLVLTPQGQRFAEADVLEEKRIFREQALARITILREIVDALQAAPAHTLPEEYVMGLLERQFSQEEAGVQFEMLVDWGRYAELFSFNEDRGLFRLEEEAAPATPS
jgi:NitT/TauT family transport system ATP-binding protein